MNRETWLNDLAALMAPKFQELGWPVPPFRVSIGFTSSGRAPNVGGECWHKSRSADARFEILIAPHQDDAMKVAAILAHELTHAAAGFKHKHKGDFAKCVAALGLLRPFTSSVPGPDFIAWVTPFLAQLGPLPHARLAFDGKPLPRDKGEDGEEGEGEEGEGDGEEGGSSNQKKKQTTRMVKVTCDGCGYTARVTRKWLDTVGAPHCAELAHGQMKEAA